ncbi:hypothetical protein JOF53_008304 [Crossiella equi]|uniref:Uncharacterized protein n=1 Tax=Crossiella equi TaxID=130796 RepID=A0ABS5AT55_9PSEU|nr:hypothetical protein [Crossiella equi]MBP2479432.1 hypothetical protein [Crossiella equi]
MKKTLASILTAGALVLTPATATAAPAPPAAAVAQCPQELLRALTRLAELLPREVANSLLATIGGRPLTVGLVLDLVHALGNPLQVSQNTLDALVAAFPEPVASDLRRLLASPSSGTAVQFLRGVLEVMSRPC